MTLHVGDTQVGTVTSGTFSPTRKQGIALALLNTDANLADGDEVEIDIRGRRAPLTPDQTPLRNPLSEVTPTRTPTPHALG